MRFGISLKPRLIVGFASIVILVFGILYRDSVLFNVGIIGLSSYVPKNYNV